MGARLRSLIALSVVATTTMVTASSTPRPTFAATTLVPEKVRTDTPVAVDGTVSDMAQIGNRIVVAGTFTQVKPLPGATAISKKYIYAFDVTTGALDTGFAPIFDAPIEAIEPSTDGASLFVVGSFNTVSGVARRKIVKLTAAGAVDATFVANASDKVSALEVGAGRIWVGGKFKTVKGTARGGLAALDATTGAVKTDFNLAIAGGIGFGGELTVKGLGVTPDLKTLIISYTGQTIGGLSRVGVAELDLSGATAVVAPWHTTLFQDGLANRGGQLWLRGFDLSPDGSYFVVTTSGGDSPPINDMVIALPVAGDEGVTPKWLSRHFDSVYSVAIDTNSVYVGGHFRYQEAPGSIEPYPGDPTVNYSFGTGPNGIGAGVLGNQVVARVQLGALDPTTGKALPWNPGSDAFNGVAAITVIPRGLLVGGDQSVVAGKTVGRAAFFDRNLAVTEANNSIITDPIIGEILPANASRIVRGTATATSGVKRVQITIQDRRTKSYMQANGTFTVAFYAFTATLGNQGTSVTWSLPITFPGGSFEIQSRSFGVDATKEADVPKVGVEAFDPADSAPDGRSLAVDLSGADGRTVTLRGTASDERGVTAVKVALRNQTANHFLRPNGAVGDFYEFNATIDNPGATGTNWSFTIAAPTDGHWYSQIVAIDTVGQRDGSPGSAGWDMFPNNTAPVVTINTPTSEATAAADASIEITGTATDDRGVARVQVHLVNLSTDQGMVGVGLLGDRASWVSATLATPNATSTAWSITSPQLPPGRYQLQVTATDTADREATTIPLINVNVSIPGDGRPAVTITSPGNATITSPNTTVAGAATDAQGVQGVRLALYSNSAPYGWLQADGTINESTIHSFSPTLNTPGGTSTNWSMAITLPHEAVWSIRAYSLDNRTQPSNPVWTSVRYSTNDQPPTFTVTTPTEGQIITGGTTVGVNGVVEDDVAVDRVVMYFYRAPFWEGPNPQNAGTVPGMYDAFVTSPGAKRSNWSITSPVLTPGSWTIYTYAIDRSGQTSPARYVTFNVGITGDAPPLAMIDSPMYAKADFTSNSFTISGRATDDKGVATVAVRIQQLGGSWLKPDGTVTGAPGDAVWTATVANPGTTSTTWTLPVTLPSGGYNIYVHTIDSVGQRQTQLNWATGGQAVQVFVTPGDTVPTITMTAPTSNSTIGGATFGVTGAATDDKGITNAWVLVRRTTDRSIGLRADGSIGAVEYVAATLSVPGGTSTNWSLNANIPAGNWEVYVYVTDITAKQAWAGAVNLTVT